MIEQIVPPKFKYQISMPSLGGKITIDRVGCQKVVSELTAIGTYAGQNALTTSLKSGWTTLGNANDILEAGAL